MFSKKDADIIYHLRSDARKKVTEISRNIAVPVTTVYERIRSQQSRGIVKRHVALVDFGKIGYQTKTHFAIKAENDSKKEMQEFLLSQPNVNSLYRVNYGYDFLAECIFRNIPESENFAEKLSETFRIREIKKFNVIEELKKEEFLTKKEHFERSGAD